MFYYENVELNMKIFGKLFVTETFLEAKNRFHHPRHGYFCVGVLRQRNVKN